MKIRIGKVEGVTETAAMIAAEIDRLAGERLVPLLEKYGAAGNVLQAAVERERDGEVVCRVHLPVPGRKIVAAEGRGPSVLDAAAVALDRLFREARRHFDRLQARDRYRRKERRRRLHDLKATIAGLGEDTRREAEQVLWDLATRLRRVVRRELAYLRAAGDLPPAYPTVADVVDEAVAAVTAEWRAGRSSREAWSELLRHAFAIINREVAHGRVFGEAVPVDADLPPTPDDQAEAMVEEEFHEFYQPDDTVTLSDVLPGEAAWEEPDRAGTEAYAWDVLKDLPRDWRRCFLLAEVEGMAPAEIAAALGGDEATVREWLAQSRAFVSARLEEAGLAAGAGEAFGAAGKAAASDGG